MKDITGRVFGQLTAIARDGRNKHGDAVWVCRCKCGNRKTYSMCTLVTGATTACGCRRIKKNKKANPPYLAPMGAAWIQLTKGKWCLVDVEDYNELSKHEWMMRGSYAGRNLPKGRGQIFMHHVLLNPPHNHQVDHRNQNKLDNRRANLRIATDTENKFNKPKKANNTSGFKGVSFHPQTGKWRVEIKAHGVRYRKNGLYETPQLAHAKYCELARKLHGEFAHTR